MNVRPNLQMDKPAFLAWVEGREGRYELVDGRVVEVTDGSRAHAQITANFFHILHSCLDRHRWTILPGFDTGPKTVRYPDVVVDPVSAGWRDSSPKCFRLRPRGSISETKRPNTCLSKVWRAYLVFAQDEQKAWIWLKDAQGFPPGQQVLNAPNESVRIAALGIEFPLSEVYARVQLD
jgi:hypothetical protein